MLLAGGAAAVGVVGAGCCFIRSRRKPDPSHLPSSLAATLKKSLASGSLNHKVVLVTGGTSGVGFNTAVKLAKHGCKVIITSRRKEGAMAGAKRVAEAAGCSEGKVDGVALDLMKFESIRSCADTVIREYDRLDGLVHNGGGVDSKHPLNGDDGLEWDYTGRVASTHLLTSLLWSLMAKSGTVDDPARVVVTSGFAVTWMVKTTASENAKWLEDEGKELEGKTIGKPPPHKPDGGMTPILASSCWARAVGAKCEGSPMRVVMSHPGLALDTGLMGCCMAAIAKTCVGGHKAAQACLGNVAAMACPAADVPQGCIVGPMHMTQGETSVVDLQSDSGGPAETWKALAGREGIRFGEMVLEEVSRKTNSNMSF